MTETAGVGRAKPKPVHFVVAILFVVVLPGVLLGIGAAAFFRPHPSVKAAATAQAPSHTSLAEFAAENDSVIEAESGCDRAGRSLAAGMRKSDRYAIYDLAERAREACEGAYLRLTSFDFTNAALDAAKQRCADAALAKAQAWKAVAALADGPAAPSAVAEARDAMGDAATAGHDCAATYARAVKAAGLG